MNKQPKFRGLQSLNFCSFETNRNQDSIQWTNMKQRGPQRNSVDKSPIISVNSPIRFHLNRVGNGNDDISSEKHFENSKTRKGGYLLLDLFIFVQLFEFYLVTKSFKELLHRPFSNLRTRAGHSLSWYPWWASLPSHSETSWPFTNLRTREGHSPSWYPWWAWWASLPSHSET